MVSPRPYRGHDTHLSGIFVSEQRLAVNLAAAQQHDRQPRNAGNSTIGQMATVPFLTRPGLDQLGGLALWLEECQTMGSRCQILK